jgi:hypothetical protein
LERKECTKVGRLEVDGTDGEDLQEEEIEVRKGIL